MEHTATIEKLTDIFRSVFNDEEIVLKKELTRNFINTIGMSSCFKIGI